MAVKIKAFYFLLLSLFIITIQGCDNRKKLENDSLQPMCIETQSHCIIKTDIGDFSILFNVYKVVTENPFDITVQLKSNNTIKTISAYMEGRDMFMGKVPLFFQESRIKNQFVANTLLGSCSEESMTWIINFSVTVETKDKKTMTETFNIEFESSRG